LINPLKCPVEGCANETPRHLKICWKHDYLKLYWTNPQFRVAKEESAAKSSVFSVVRNAPYALLLESVYSHLTTQMGEAPLIGEFVEAVTPCYDTTLRDPKKPKTPYGYSAEIATGRATANRLARGP
jgi:hypothetical protein